MKDKFNILYFVDNNFIKIDDKDKNNTNVDGYYNLEMMCMSLNTLLKYNKIDTLYIIYFNVTKDEVNKYLKQHIIYDLSNININLIYFDITLVDKYFPVLNNTCNKRLRYPSLGRWFISKLIPNDYVWYIDTDILFSDNIRDYFIKKQNEYELMFSFNRKNYSFYKIFNIHEDENNYYTYLNYIMTKKLNGGILYINNIEFNNLDLFNEIISYYKDNNESIYYMNQDGYQYIFDKYPDKCYVEISPIYNIKPFFYKKCEKSNININSDNLRLEIIDKVNSKHWNLDVQGKYIYNNYFFKKNDNNIIKIYHLNGMSQKCFLGTLYNIIINSTDC